MKLAQTGSKYGAQMGRSGEEVNRGHPEGEVCECNLIPIGIDNQGYDAGGAYWGTPSDLWRLFNVEWEDWAEGELITIHLRADNRQAAEELAHELANGDIKLVPYAGEFDVQEMLDAYAEAALWSSGGSGPYPTEGGEEVETLDSHYNISDIDDETMAWMRADVEKFLEVNRDDVLKFMETKSLASCGYDFWMSRFRTGVGFLDRGMGQLGRHLDVAAEKFSEHHSLWVDETTWKIRHE